MKKATITVTQPEGQTVTQEIETEARFIRVGYDPQGGKVTVTPADPPDDQLNRRLAELLGWKLRGESPIATPPPGTPSIDGSATIPDYCADLNAVHEVIREASVGITMEYHRQMALAEYIPIFTAPLNPYQRTALIDATARQRTIALIRTLENHNI